MKSHENRGKPRAAYNGSPITPIPSSIVMGSMTRDYSTIIWQADCLCLVGREKREERRTCFTITIRSVASVQADARQHCSLLLGPHPLASEYVFFQQTTYIDRLSCYCKSYKGSFYLVPVCRYVQVSRRGSALEKQAFLKAFLRPAMAHDAFLFADVKLHTIPR